MRAKPEPNSQITKQGTRMIEVRDEPRWRCPHCYSDELMIHRPVWETGPIDQRAEADEPCFDWTDIFDEVEGMPIEFDCCTCERRLSQILRRKMTDPVTYELWPSEAEEALGI
jgi:hypothetical protein